jgi:hypothetical protein
MQIRSDIQDTGRRIAEAAGLFGFKLRATADEFEELAAIWDDDRAVRFRALHIDPQAEVMNAGSLLWDDAAASVETVEAESTLAERALEAAAAAAADFEFEAQSAVGALRASDELAAWSFSAADRVCREIADLRGAVESAVRDPGWS